MESDSGTLSEGLSEAQKVLSNPLLLGLIFDGVSFEDLKRYRLVNRTWEQSCKMEWGKRSRLILENKGKGARALKFLMMCACNHGDIKILRRVPDNFIQICRSSVTNLILHEVQFADIASLKKLIFWNLPALQSLELDGVQAIQGQAALMGVTREVGAGTLVSTRVTKLTIKRALKLGKNYDDLFTEWGFSEILRNFADLKDLWYYDYRNLGGEPYVHHLFDELTAAKIKLKWIKLMLGHKFPFESSRTYVETYGSNITHFEATSQSLFESSFKEESSEHLESLRFPLFQLAATPLTLPGQFDNLVELWMDARCMDSLDFLIKMPNLKALGIGCGKFTASQLTVKVENVHTLELGQYYGCDYDALLDVFPGIKDLTLTGWNMYQKYTGILKNVAERYPNLERLCFTNASELAVFEPEIKGFSAKKKAERLERCTRHSKQGNVDLSSLQYVSKLENLRCFEQIVTEDKKQTLFFGDDAATSTFLKLPKLHRLKLCNVAMSDDVVNRLKEEIPLTDITRG